MRKNLFWLSDVQWKQIEPHLPTDVRGVERADACPCCRNALHRIGEDVSERLDIIPAQLRVLVVRRPKYGCRACEEVVMQAPAPARLIEGDHRLDELLPWATRRCVRKKFSAETANSTAAVCAFTHIHNLAVFMENDTLQLRFCETNPIFGAPG